MTEWSINSAIELAKVAFSGGSSSGPSYANVGAEWGTAMGAYVKALAESIEELRKTIDE